MPDLQPAPEVCHAADPDEWRAWLAANSRTEKEVWLRIPHKDSGVPGLTYGIAIEHALCYGWIDSLARKHDAHSSRLRFSPRNPRSTWSSVNRERVARMTAAGLMTPAGQDLIDLAKAKGTWEPVPEADAFTVPDDLRAALGRDEAAQRNFAAFPPSSRRLILQWIATAKRPETRERRVVRTAELASRNIRANHPA
ncbi:YdeI/OmpD-associated family protein [Yinghuangia soli]|uniref:YdeI/OmpD-associated family protein n=1 Tax=Yinghuangia soli TaxID=2908204 RepID=A0AA41PTZ9_9ACTN|nr:YdeI/OmpD-associated family protein [Yinghuangia soli]MCF2525844.1 YdeI/OmpD-associated family protein [Yinghuangia soli]